MQGEEGEGGKHFLTYHQTRLTGEHRAYLPLHSQVPLRKFIQQISVECLQWVGHHLGSIGFVSTLKGCNKKATKQNAED